MMKNFFRIMLYLLLFVGIGSVAVYLVLQVIEQEETVEVPSLGGKSLAEARKLLETRGISLVVAGEEYDREMPPDSIISQDIKEGEKVQSGAIVQVIISSEKARFQVPSLEGMEINDVRLTVQKSGMEIGRVLTVHSDSIEKDRVIAQRPLPGKSDEKTVNLVVSLGPYVVSYTCPSFLELTLKEARGLAQALGLRLREKNTGRVIVFQEPEAGAPVNKGDTIEVTLGRGRGFWF